MTVTRVELTPDLRYARVYVGVLGRRDGAREEPRGPAQAAGFVRRELGQRLRMRHTPELDFHYDKGLDATDRVARLLAGGRGAREPPGEGDGGGGGE